MHLLLEYYQPRYTVVALLLSEFNLGSYLENREIRPKRIHYLFSVTWSKSECGMRDYLFIFYFGLDMIQRAHIFYFAFFIVDYHV